MTLFRLFQNPGRKRQTRVRFADCEKDDEPQEKPPVSASELIKNINAKVTALGTSGGGGCPYVHVN